MSDMNPAGPPDNKANKRPVMGVYDRPNRPAISPIMIGLILLVIIAVIALLFIFVLPH